MALHQRVGIEAMQEGETGRKVCVCEEGTLWCYPWPSILWASMSSRGRA